MKVNAREAAEHLGVAERTVRRWIKAGRLPAEKRDGSYAIELELAEGAVSRNVVGRQSTALSVAELRGRYVEAKTRLREVERDLAEERRRVATLEAELCFRKQGTFARAS